MKNEELKKDYKTKGRICTPEENRETELEFIELEKQMSDVMKNGKELKK